MADFAYAPSEITESAEFSVAKIQFGDGYAQRVPNGINNNLRTWKLQFANRSLVDANAMIAFFRLKAGATSFTWRPQGYAVDVTVVCSDYSRPTRNQFIDGAFVYDLSATFEETPL